MDNFEKEALIIHSDKFYNFDLGRFHPLRPFRVKLFYMLLEEIFGRDSFFRYLEPEEMEEELLVVYHDPGYLGKLKSGVSDREAGLGTDDNPVVEGLYDWALESVKGTVTILRHIEDYRVLFNPGGGMHHAWPDRASGFCYLNDIVIAIKELKMRRPDLRVFYLDMDAHHGDAVQNAFYHRSDVLTVSIHEEDIFPFSGSIEELGEGEGYGYNVNVPIPRYSEDEDVWYIFENLVFPLLIRYKPDLVFIQVGADAHKDDPLTTLYLTTGIYSKISRELGSLYRGPFALTGGGGYDIVNVARIWTIFLAGLLGKRLPDRLPERFLRISVLEGYDGPFLEDIPGWTGLRSQVKEVIKERVDFLKKRIPLLGG